MTTVGYIRTNEFSAQLNEFPDRDFDLLLCVGSWEQRSLAVSRWQHLSASETCILRFASRRDDTAKDRNIQSLCDHFAGRSTCSVADLPPATEMSRAFDVVGRVVSSASHRLGRKLRVCIDVSTMPRSLISYLLLMGFRTKMVDELSFFFAVSDHNETLKLVAEAGDGSRSPHVEGNWNLISIPYGEGVVKGSRHDQIVISVGLDTYQIIDVIDRIEPISAIFLMPCRGDGSRMDALAEDRFRAIANRYSPEFDIGRFRRISVQPYDMGWLPTLSSMMDETFQYTDAAVLLYPFGPKIHSVGLSLLALHDERIAVVGRTPSSYHQRKVEATNYGHLIELVDLSSVSSLRRRLNSTNGLRM